MFICVYVCASVSYVFVGYVCVNCVCVLCLCAIACVSALMCMLMCAYVCAFMYTTNLHAWISGDVFFCLHFRQECVNREIFPPQSVKYEDHTQSATANSCIVRVTVLTERGIRIFGAKTQQ